MRSSSRVLAAVAAALVGAACDDPNVGAGGGGAGGAAPIVLAPPGGAKIGDELVVTVAATSVDGSWGDPSDVGAIFRVTAGANTPRDVILVGGFAAEVRASLGAWDGGEIRAETIAGHAAANLELAVDPSAAGIPLMGLMLDPGNDTPLLCFQSGDELEYVMTNEDGGTGLFPTLLLAQWGRPHDIEGLWNRKDETYQGPNHATLAFDGAREGSHPRLVLSTSNGLVSPEDATAPAPLHVAPMPVPFAGGEGVPREAVLDAYPWLVAAGWLEVEREGKVALVGTPTDGALAPLGSWVFLDHRLDGDAKVAFEAEVDGAWYSSLSTYAGASDALDARASGTGRTSIELPTGKTLADVTSIRVVGSVGTGTLVKLRLLAYDPGSYVVVEGGALASPLPIEPSTSAVAITRM